MNPDRRQFSHQALGSLVAFGFIEMLWSRDLFAASIKPTITDWLKDLVAMTNDLRGQKLTDLQFQMKMEELYKRVDLQALVGLVKLDEIEKKSKLPDSGALSAGIDFKKMEGLPSEVTFGKQLFGCKKDRSIVPHGHLNMCTGFIVLKGEWHGRHYDRVETLKDHYVIKPTIDQTFKPGELSTISDHKDNVHWFKAATESAYIFNVHVIGYDPTIKGNSGRMYLDPDGEKLSGGLVKAAKMTSEACHKKYG
ncbi:hypothetical protein [Limnoglobus roseus]|uniref:Cupin domain-containing protein n=1 Tax=Limnoglobus roseus TaxID=2598579 RepID=A0A5C1AGF5_9BACT|nr:hypothetical protein [Limnoglobus roseus]QEL17910.1 hypothetical protein PX52LOC_04922 [Limnoglobus roseus]